jgi:signal transduction histidine kinase
MNPGTGGSVHVRHLAPPVSLLGSLVRARRAPKTRAGSGLGGAAERRRIERDPHDGVQTELVALIIGLSAAQQNPHASPILAEALAELETRAQAALDSVRGVARGIYPAVLSDFGLRRALCAQATRAAVQVNITGTVARGSEEAEEAVYFACSEAIQNVAKHAGGAARAAVRFFYRPGLLAVRIADDGSGFDPERTPEGTGLSNIRDRIEGLRGTFTLASATGAGTVLTLTLPWSPPDRCRR